MREENENADSGPSMSQHTWCPVVLLHTEEMLKVTASLGMTINKNKTNSMV
jgi:hypothetical protein